LMGIMSQRVAPTPSARGNRLRLVLQAGQTAVGKRGRGETLEQLDEAIRRMEAVLQDEKVTREYYSNNQGLQPGYNQAHGIYAEVATRDPEGWALLAPWKAEFDTYLRLPGVPPYVQWLLFLQRDPEYSERVARETKKWRDDAMKTTAWPLWLPFEAYLERLPRDGELHNYWLGYFGRFEWLAKERARGVPEELRKAKARRELKLCQALKDNYEAEYYSKLAEERRAQAA